MAPILEDAVGGTVWFARRGRAIQARGYSGQVRMVVSFTSASGRAVIPSVIG